MTLFHHKQLISAQGATYADSFAQTMKGQSLDVWDMFTRESLQNSWDARDKSSDEDGVTFSVRYSDLDPRQTSFLRDEIFGAQPEGLPELASALKERRFSLLKVCDAGTNGLRGPTTAVTSEDEDQDFVSFVRNIGRSSDKTLAGGTYGFGKSVFFIVSRVKTILVYTRTTDEKGYPSSRFIAIANGRNFDEGNQPYTGRHWWGRKAVQASGSNRIEYAEPLLDAEADRMAAHLGLADHFTDQRPRGTCVAVLNPDFDSAPERGLQQVASSLTRWAWPHMTDVETGLDPIDFSVSINDQDIQIPDPMQDTALKHYVMLYRKAVEEMEFKSPNTWEQDILGRLASVESGSPRKKLGNLAVTSLQKPILEEDTVIQKTISRHVATMRRPRMVVEYYEGPTSLSARPYLGVFVADDAADEVFARSEPAAHHEWNYQTAALDQPVLKRFWGSASKNNPVRIFFRKLRELLATESAHGIGTDEPHYRSLTNLSSTLGSFISNALGGTDTSRDKAKPRRSTRTSHSRAGQSARVSYSLRVSSIVQDGEALLSTFDVDVEIPKELGRQVIEAIPYTHSDSEKISTEDLKKNGLPFPEFSRWVNPDISDPELELDPGAYSLQVLVSHPREMAVGVHLFASSSEDETEGSN